MRQFLLSKPNLTLVALVSGIVSTLAYDYVASQNVESGVAGWIETVWIEWVLFSAALPFRLFSYAALFFSFPLLAEQLRGQRQRLFCVTSAWFVSGLVLMLIVWSWMALSDNLGLGYAIKRMSPNTMAHFAPELTLAEIALGSDLAKKYTWSTAISLEILALLLISISVAAFLWRVAHSKMLKVAFLAPAIPVLVLIAYNVLAPWSLDIDFDVFIGDALLGATLFNGLFLPLTLIFGGATAPSIWVGLIAVTNLFFVRAWSRKESGADI